MQGWLKHKTVETHMGCGPGACPHSPGAQMSSGSGQKPYLRGNASNCLEMMTETKNQLQEVG